MKQKTDDEDIINSPSHYIEGRKIEPIDVMEDWGLDGDYYLANVIKYISRYKRKTSIEDPTTCLKKARFYLDRRISIEEGKPIWIKCKSCEDYICTVHKKHVHECACPGVEEMERDPYWRWG
jgi:hypothetical protein